MSKEKTGAAKKEYFRKKKKKITKERKEYFERKRVEAAEAKGLHATQNIQKPDIKKTPEEKMPLNKYIAHSGVCSRRDAVDIIKTGKVKGKLLLNPAIKSQLAT